MRRIVVIALSVILALVVAIPMASGTPKADQGQTIGKKILGELGAEWWTWALEKPTATNPLVAPYPDGCEGPFSLKGREVFFLAGTVTGEAVTRECTVAHKTWLFFPVVNSVELWPTGEKTEQFLRDAANNSVDRNLVGSTMFVTVDGKQLRVSIKQQRADTPLFTLILPEDNIFGGAQEGAPGGPYEAVADGVWVLLPPLKKGEHTITFGGSFRNGAFTQNNTYILTVV